MSASDSVMPSSSAACPSISRVSRSPLVMFLRYACKVYTCTAELTADAIGRFVERLTGHRRH